VQLELKVLLEQVFEDIKVQQEQQVSKEQQEQQDQKVQLAFLEVRAQLAHKVFREPRRQWAGQVPLAQTAQLAKLAQLDRQEPPELAPQAQLVIKVLLD
jgi:RNase adaptor protein for sRNA GlmZ degradation